MTLNYSLKNIYSAHCISYGIAADSEVLNILPAVWYKEEKPSSSYTTIHVAYKN
jgi:hypothetical protein